MTSVFESQRRIVVSDMQMVFTLTLRNRMYR